MPRCWGAPEYECHGGLRKGRDAGQFVPEVVTLGSTGCPVTASEGWTSEGFAVVGQSRFREGDFRSVASSRIPFM